MACRLIGAKPLSEPVLECSLLDHVEQTSMTFSSKYKIFEISIQRNAFENVWKMAAILSRPQCDNEVTPFGL